MYHVDVGVPKTLLRYIIESALETQSSPHIAAVLRDICAVPIHLSFRVSMAVLNRLPRN
jgi:hypothetical protein